MRRLAVAVAAAALALACSSSNDGPAPDTTPPAVPVILVPAQGAHLVATDLVGPDVIVSGTAEPGATVEVVVFYGVLEATESTVAASDGTWSVSAMAASGVVTARARAIDAAGNASGWCDIVSFTIDTAPLASPLPAGWPYLPVTSWGQAVPVGANEPSGLGELFPGQANSWVVDRDFSLATGFGLQYTYALVLHTGAPTSPRSHATLLDDLLSRALTAFPGDQTFSEATFLTPTFGDQGTRASVAVSDGLSMGLPAISGSSAYLNGSSHTVLGGYLLEFAPGETYTFGWTHQAVLQAGRLVGAGAAPYAPSYRVVLREPASPQAMIGEPLFSTSTHVPRATESATRTGLPQHAVLQFELRSAAPGYVQLDDLTLSDSAGPIALRNPGFENGFDGWAYALSSGSSQNVRSGARDVGPAGSTLRVTRTFFAPEFAPATWGRMVDVFENTGTEDVTTTVVYATFLEGQAPLAAVTQGGRAVVGWDGAGTVRDVGIVFGTGTAFVAEGSRFVFVTHDLSVPAGGKVALAHFVVQLGEAGGGPTPPDVPGGTDAECAAVLAGFPGLWSTSYRAHLEPGVLDLVQNL